MGTHYTLTLERLLGIYIQPKAGLELSRSILNRRCAGYVRSAIKSRLKREIIM